MKYLIDTDWVIDHLNGRQRAIGLLGKLAHDGIAISLVTVGEVYDGVYRGQNSLKAEAVFEEFCRWVDILPLNEAIMRRFARIRGQLDDEGRGIGHFDILIAATALESDLTVVTRNRRHFERIGGLKLLPEDF